MRVKHLGIVCVLLGRTGVVPFEPHTHTFEDPSGRELKVARQITIFGTGWLRVVIRVAFECGLHVTRRAGTQSMFGEVRVGGGKLAFVRRSMRRPLQLNGRRPPPHRRARVLTLSLSLSLSLSVSHTLSFDLGVAFYYSGTVVANLRGYNVFGNYRRKSFVDMEAFMRTALTPAVRFRWRIRLPLETDETYKINQSKRPTGRPNKKNPEGW